MTADKNLTVKWDDAHRYSPAPRHRRRLFLNWLRPLAFAECLDVGCAQPYLLAELAKQGKRIVGCDLSDQVIRENCARMPGVEFAEVDVAQGCFPGGRTFELVIASEVLEHIVPWQQAIANLCAMSSRFVMITVPSGRLYPIDQRVGHVRHFQGPEIAAELQGQGFRILRQRHWGFPLHSLYKVLINGLARERIYAQFSVARYSWPQRWLSAVLYGLFYVNDVFAGGGQYLCLAVRDQEKGATSI